MQSSIARLIMPRPARHAVFCSRCRRLKELRRLVRCQLRSAASRPATIRPRVTDRAGRDASRGSAIDALRLSVAFDSLSPAAAELTFLESDIAGIQQRAPDPLSNGAWRGLPRAPRPWTCWPASRSPASSDRDGGNRPWSRCSHCAWRHRRGRRCRHRCDALSSRTSDPRRACAGVPKALACDGTRFAFAVSPRASAGSEDPAPTRAKGRLKPAPTTVQSYQSHPTLA